MTNLEVILIPSVYGNYKWILDLIPFSIIKETNLDLFISQHGVLKQRPIPVIPHPFFFLFL